MKSPEQIVQQQLDYYNSRNMEGYISLFADDVKFYNYGSNELTIDGVEACQSVYQNLFDQSPSLKSTITKRITFDNIVIDHESITGRMGIETPLELALIFEIENEKICKVTVIK